MKNVNASSIRDSIIVVVLAVLLGSIIRLGYILKFPFPLNDGGLFYKMTQELVNNHFLLPDYSSYNNLSIPFAYPPLPFYLAGFLNSFFRIDMFNIFRFLPFIFNILTIPVVYLVARKILRNNAQANLAVLIYALIRPGYEWFIYGGGLTRSMGWLFALLAILQILKFYETKKFHDAIFISILFSLTILCHLEIGWFLVLSFLLLTFFLNRSRNGFFSFLLVGIATLLLTSFYWIRLVSHYGWSIISTVFHSGQFNFFYSLLKIFQFNFTGEVFFPVISVFALLGIFVAIASRNYLLPVWLLVIVGLDSRSVDRSSTLVISFLAALAIDSIVPLVIKKYKQGYSSRFYSKRRIFPIIHLEPVLISMVFFIIFFGTGLEMIMETQKQIISITQDDVYAMQWVKGFTTVNSKFLIVDSARAWQTDAQAEWFPALAERQSILTPQGTEWLPGQIFDQKISLDDEFRRGLMTGNFFLPEWLLANKSEYQFVYFEKSTLQQYNLNTSNLPNFLKVVYENNSVLIMEN
jgi:hypothetical protein